MIAGRPAVALEAHPFVRRLELLASTESTHDDVRRLAASGAPEGTVLVADEQTRGRGRLGRPWHSPAGAGLYLSVLLRPEEAQETLGRYALVAAIAGAEACRAGGAPAATIKWPNDLLADGRKLGGILAELRTGPAGAELVLGFGINLNHAAEDFPADLRARAVSLRQISGTRTEPLEFAARVVDALAGEVGRLRAGLWDAIAAAFVARAPGVVGADVRLTTGERGVTRGLDPSGALRVETDGGVRAVHAGESLAALTG